MTYDPALLDELARVFAEAVVRDLESKNAAVAPTKENDNGVKDEREQHTSRPLDSVFPRVDA